LAVGLGYRRKKYMEFLDGFKAVELHPLERLKQATRFVGSIVRNTNVQLCESDHYIREHFTDEPVQPPVTQPAQPWNQER